MVCKQPAPTWSSGYGAVLNPKVTETGTDLLTQEITVRVKNFGEAALSQISVRYKVGSIPRLGTVTQTVEPGETVDYTFATPYEFVASKVYTITACTELVEDSNPGNDVCTKEVGNRRPDAIPVNGLARVPVYPNPAREVVRIDAAETLIQRITILSNQGVLLMKKDPVESTYCELPLDLPAITYLLRIDSEEGSAHEKLVVR